MIPQSKSPSCQFIRGQLPTRSSSNHALSEVHLLTRRRRRTKTKRNRRARFKNDLSKSVAFCSSIVCCRYDSGLLGLQRASCWSRCSLHSDPLRGKCYQGRQGRPCLTIQTQHDLIDVKYDVFRCGWYHQEIHISRANFARILRSPSQTLSETQGTNIMAFRVASWLKILSYF